MDISQLQNWVRDDWAQRSKHAPGLELQLLYIIEELGEVAEAVRKLSGNKDRNQTTAHLGSELADLIVSITTLANHFDIDLANELIQFKERLTERHAKGF